MNIELNKNNFLIVIGLFLLALFLSLNNPMNPFVGQPASGTDVSVFRTVAMVMGDGGAPYEDSFDHKGPLLYIVYWLAGNISWNHGIWWICFLAVLMTTLYMYKTALFFSDSKVASWVVFFSMAPAFHRYYQGGGYTEDLSLPFITIALYFFIRWHVSRNLTNKHWFILGLSLAAIALLRVNMIVVYLCFLPFVLWASYSQGKYKYIMRSGMLFFLGIGVFFLPVLYWLYTNGIIVDCWNSYIEFNRLYVEKSTLLWSDRISTLNWFIQHEGVFLTVIGAICLCVRDRSKFNAVYAIFVIVSLLSVCLSGKKFGHYGMILVPAAVYPLSFLYHRISNVRIIKRCGRVILSIFVVIILQLTVKHPLMDIYAMVTDQYSENDVRYSSEIVDVVEMIEHKTDSLDKIVVIGNKDLLYLASNRLPAVQYSYQYPIAEVDQNIMQRFLEQMNQVKPKVVIIEKKEKHKVLVSKVEPFVADNYKMILDNGKYMVFEHVE